MIRKCPASLASLVLTVALMGMSGCSCSRQDLTYIPFDENHGEPTLGKQVESVPDGMGERMDRFDRRLEAWLY